MAQMYKREHDRVLCALKRDVDHVNRLGKRKHPNFLDSKWASSYLDPFLDNEISLLDHQV